MQPDGREMNREPEFSIAGIGSALPERRVSNDDVARLVGIPAVRIASWFDIRERRWLRVPAAGPVAVDASLEALAVQAARAALADADTGGDAVDAVIAVSTTSQYVAPPLDYFIQHGIGGRNGFACTLHGACTGLFRAALIASQLIQSGVAGAVLIVLADAVSPFFVFDPEAPKDLRMSMALYGDGAAAMLVVPPCRDLPRASCVGVRANQLDQKPGIALSWQRVWKQTGVQAFGTDLPGYHDFRRVLREGGRLTIAAARAVLDRAHLDFHGVQHILTHQATGNMRAVAAELGLPAEKLRINIDRVGNTLSPSILILLDELRRSGKIAPGDLLLLHSAESATWSYGGMLVDWV